MRSHTVDKKNMTVLFLLAIFLGAVSASPDRNNDRRLMVLYAGSKSDYGSGASIRTDWYTPGGLGGGIGMFVGHPNIMARSDRAVLRFNLATYLLRPVDEIKIDSAVLQFQFQYVHGKDARRRIEISHLAYEARSFSGNDLVNAEVQMVTTVTVRPQAPTKTFLVNVAPFIKSDIEKGYKYSAFRFRDVTAETRGNPDLQAAGVTLAWFAENRPALKIKEHE